MSWFHWWMVPALFTVWVLLGWSIDQWKYFQEDIWKWIINWLIMGPMLVVLVAFWGLCYGVSLAFK